MFFKKPEVFQLTVICTTLYTALFFWKNFRKKKRMENLCVNSKEALVALEESKKVIEKKESSQAQKEKIKEVLNKLKKALMLVRKDKDLKEYKVVSDSIKFIEELIKILDHKYENCSTRASCAFVLIDFREKCGLLKQGSFKIVKFEKLRETLLSMHEMT